jgi:hypothetical protein
LNAHFEACKGDIEECDTATLADRELALKHLGIAEAHYVDTIEDHKIAADRHQTAITQALGHFEILELTTRTLEQLRYLNTLRHAFTTLVSLRLI